MSAPIPAAQFDLHVARSTLLDAFSSAEGAVRRRAAALGHEPKSVFTQNIDLILKSTPNPRYSKKDKAKVDAALSELRTMHGLRCDIVHGRMSLVRIDNAELACFVNAQKVGPNASVALLMSRQQLEDTARSLHDLAGIVAPTSQRGAPVAAPERPLQ